jgi:hypothetical protein
LPGCNTPEELFKVHQLFEGVPDRHDPQPGVDDPFETRQSPGAPCALETILPLPSVAKIPPAVLNPAREMLCPLVPNETDPPCVTVRKDVVFAPPLLTPNSRLPVPVFMPKE